MHVSFCNCNHNNIHKLCRYLHGNLVYLQDGRPQSTYFCGCRTAYLGPAFQPTKYSYFRNAGLTMCAIHLIVFKVLNILFCSLLCRKSQVFFLTSTPKSNLDTALLSKPSVQNKLDMKLVCCRTIEVITLTVNCADFLLALLETQYII